MKSRIGPFIFLGVLVLFLGCAPAIFAQNEGGAIVAIDEPASGTGTTAGVKSYGGSSSQKKTQPAKQKGGKASAKTTTPRTFSTPSAAPKRTVTAWNGPILGDKYTFLNFEVVSAAKPYHTREAKANGAKGLVQVEILIGSDGSVLSARARTGNPLLHPEAERAALESKFNRPTLYGQPARATGFLVYRFGPAED